MGTEHDNDFSGVWRSHYTYHSNSRGGDFEGEHLVRFYRNASGLVVESVPGTGSSSYLILRLSIDGKVATGTWQEETSPEGYYAGAIYSGAIQLIMSDDGKHLHGKWVGIGKDSEISTGPWEFDYVGSELPKPTEKAA